MKLDFALGVREVKYGLRYVAGSRGGPDRGLTAPFEDVLLFLKLG